MRSIEVVVEEPEGCDYPLFLANLVIIAIQLFGWLTTVIILLL